MAKKLITATVETIASYSYDYDITIPANTKEYFHILPISGSGNTSQSTESVYVYNKTSASVTIEKIRNGEIVSTYTVGPHKKYRDSIEKGEYIRLKDFKNYEDAIFIEWPKS